MSIKSSGEQNLRCTMGIEGLDDVLGGGVPRNLIYLSSDVSRWTCVINENSRNSRNSDCEKKGADYHCVRRDFLGSAFQHLFDHVAHLCRHIAILLAALAIFGNALIN